MGLPDKKVDRPIPWVEKYRPRRIEDLVHQDEVANTLKKAVETGNLPHLLFYGPPGTGKTSAILAAARTLFGDSLWKARTLELNASDERGIDVVRNKVKNFAQTAVKDQAGVPGFKLIVLDEADSMTSDAQTALRRTMEQYSSVTRFCVLCNYVSRIIEPITSRCAKFRFKPLPQDLVVKRLEYILTQEGYSSPSMLQLCERVYDLSSGDLRKAVTLLEAAAHLSGAKKEMTVDHVMAVGGKVPDSVVFQLFSACCEAEGTLQGVEDAVNNVLNLGYSAALMVEQLVNMVVNWEGTELTEVDKAYLSLSFAHADRCLVQGADEYLQLWGVCTQVWCRSHNVAISKPLEAL